MGLTLVDPSTGEPEFSTLNLPLTRAAVASAVPMNRPAAVTPASAKSATLRNIRVSPQWRGIHARDSDILHRSSRPGNCRALVVGLRCDIAQNRNKVPEMQN